MCRVAQLDLAPDPRSTPAARSFVRRCLEDWQLADVREALELPLSELVTNALMHARTPITVAVSAVEQHVEVAVADRSPEPPRPRPQRQDLHSDLELLRLAELATEELLDERDPRLDVGDAGSVVGGRGLLLVHSLVDSWGVRETADGKAVWIRAATPRGWPLGAGCSCARTGPIDRR